MRSQGTSNSITNEWNTTGSSMSSAAGHSSCTLQLRLSPVVLTCKNNCEKPRKRFETVYFQRMFTLNFCEAEDKTESHVRVMIYLYLNMKISNDLLIFKYDNK